MRNLLALSVCTLTVTFFVVGTLQAAASRGESVTHVIIEASGPQMPRADTASMVELADGRLMVVYQRYEATEKSGRDEGFCRIWSKQSRDGGRTWGSARMLVDVVEGDVNVMNPELVRLTSGGLLLICHRYHPPKPSTSTCIVFRSEDDGRTFVEEGSIWKRPDSYRVAIPPVLQLSSNRILLPFCARGGDHFPKNFAAGCYCSDDDGKSWTLCRGRINLPKRGAMEPSVAELDDGTLVMSLRTQLGGPFLSRSTDGGNSWTPAQFTGLEGGESGTCLKRIPGSNRLLLLWNNSKYLPNHHHFGERTPLSAAVSDDGGKTWRKVGTIGDDPQAEYTNLECCFTSQGKAVITYMFAKPAWNRHRIDLRAAVVDVDWFRQTREAVQK